ncbi:hypothetical protein ACWC5C_21090 [Streptomyces sp. NPDC001700]
MEWFQRQAASDPETFAVVERLVLTMHEVSCPVTEAAVEAGVGWHQVGRAHAALESLAVVTVSTIVHRPDACT